jgi:signal transduction histidine kinase/CheY-like chemotaxis protein
MAVPPGEEELLAIDEDRAEAVTPSRRPWRVLVVDDEPEVHEATTFALGGMAVAGAPVAFMHAYSARQARDLIAAHPDIAVILLDVVLEAQDAGLGLVRVIREELKNPIVRIILRTGQPGYAPELEVMQRYDINDYKSKSELTRTTLTTVITASIRSCQQLSTIATRQAQAAAIAEMSATLFGDSAAELDSTVASALDRLRALWRLDRCCLMWQDDAAGALVPIGAGTPHTLDRAGIAELCGGSVVRAEAPDGGAMLLIPVQIDARLAGCLGVSTSPGDAGLEDDDLVLLRVAADVIGAGVHRIRRRREILDINASLERRVAERTRELERANRDLEAYSYSVSHDLRAPLRRIGGFVGLLQDALGPGLDAETRRYLDVITDSVGNMERLIADLLRFAQLGRAAIRIEAVDCAAMVEELRRELDPGPPRRIEWRVGSLPALSVDRALFRQVLVNLIGNAIKYTRDRDPAVIAIDATVPADEPGMVRLSVRDNGTGFDMRDAGRLFRPFSRLHSAVEFEGSGIGLATAASLVERHGGRIWAEAAPGAGATFHLALPRAPARA